MSDRILILDFGSQYTQLIARRLRESGVYCEILPCTADDARDSGVRAAGRDPVRQPGLDDRDRGAARAGCRLRAGVPILGICYGEQTLCAQLGGKVELGHHREFGRAFLDVTGRCALFEGVFEPGAREQVWMSHGDKIVELPPGFRVVATSDGLAVRRDRRRPAPDLRRPVPPRGRAHAARQGAAAQFQPPGRGLPRRLVDGRLPRGARSRASATRSAARG